MASLVSGGSPDGTSVVSSDSSVIVSGTVYTEDNNATCNHVLMFERDQCGDLSKVGDFSTHGKGTGTGLGSQGALALTEDGQWLLAVNAGSHDISVFKVADKALVFTDKVGSHGPMPISLTVNNGTVYVLDAGGCGNIAGFNLSSSGHLTFISGSARPLSGTINSSPEQIGFNNDGSVLVVSEKGADLIDTYAVNTMGQADGPMITPSNGKGPYGFAFDQVGHLVLSEAATNALSSYNVSDNGSLTLISGSVPSGGSAPCWVVVTPTGMAYTTNAHGGTISVYDAGSSGDLTLLSSTAATTKVPALDMALSNESHILYVLNGNQISGFCIRADGNLTAMGSIGGLPASTTGLMAT